MLGGGDDTAFLWTHQKYDWMGRVIRKIATDGADSPTLNDSDVLISYEGCGCAGGMVTTVEGERVPIPGTENFARRKQKVYQDILGRTWKTEAYEWDGTTVYATAVMGDAALAKTAYELGESDVVVIDEDTNDTAEILRYSSAWDNALNKFCGPR